MSVYLYCIWKCVCACLAACMWSASDTHSRTHCLAPSGHHPGVSQDALAQGYRQSVIPCWQLSELHVYACVCVYEMMTGEWAEAVSLLLFLNRNNRILVFICVALSEKSEWRPAVVVTKTTQRQLMTSWSRLSDDGWPAKDPHLYILPEQATEAYSTLMMCFRENITFINNIL